MTIEIKSIDLNLYSKDMGGASKEHSICFEQASKLFSPFPLIHGVTHRHGGVSKGEYRSLNLGFHVGDDPHAVVENRRRLAQVLGVDGNRFTCGEQVHGIGVAPVRESDVGRGALSLEGAIPQSDALHTNLVGVPLLLLVADCVPVLVYDALHHAIAVIHAGWRGAIAHIVEHTLLSMKENYGTDVKDCFAYIGPSIGKHSFEVSEEIAEAFRQDMRHLPPSVKDEVVTYSFHQGKLEKTPHVDLKSYLAHTMHGYGMDYDAIAISEVDTMQDDQYFSYRRDGGKTGRMALFGMLLEREGTEEK